MSENPKDRKRALSRHGLHRGHDAPVKDESEVRWLISYSDFMMQLVCLFILLYSVSATDAGKTSAIAQSWREEQGLQPVAVRSDPSRGDSIPLTVSLLPSTLKEIQAIVSRYPEGGHIRITPAADGFRLQVVHELFEEGSSVLTKSGERYLDLAAQILHPYQYVVRSMEIVGHTATGDSEKEDGSGLRLALSRSRSAVRWVTRMGLANRLDAYRLGAAGRGPHEPAVDNADPRTRAMNRRVDFVVHLHDESPAVAGP